MSGCPAVSALNTRTGAPLEKLPSTVDIPTDTAASIDWPMIAPRASAPPPVNSSSALTPCFLKMPARLPISVMEVSHAPRCGTAIFNVSCADAGACQVSTAAAAAANRSETVFMTPTDNPLHDADNAIEHS